MGLLADSSCRCDGTRPPINPRRHLSLLDEALQEEWGEVMRYAKLGLGDVNESDANGVSVLHLAAAAGRRALVELLLNCGATLTREHVHGQSALSFAIQTGEMSVANTILST